MFPWINSVRQGAIFPQFNEPFLISRHCQVSRPKAHTYKKGWYSIVHTQCWECPVTKRTGVSVQWHNEWCCVFFNQSNCCFTNDFMDTSPFCVFVPEFAGLIVPPHITMMSKLYPLIRIVCRVILYLHQGRDAWADWSRVTQICVHEWITLINLFR